MDKASKWLVVTEKPSVAGDLAKALGGFEKKGDHYESPKYYITWAVGHLLELLEPEELDPKYKRWLLQDLPILPQEFQYKPKKGQTERLNHIKSLAKKSDVSGIINACDAGREGELIFREIYDFCTIKKPFKRIWLQSMTPESIRKEFQTLKPGHDYDNLGDAARCRAESDWLIGMNATRAVTKRLKTRNTKGVWSVGRVQTPTLALIAKRELDYLKHRPEPFFNLEGRFSTPTHEYSGLWFDPKFKKSHSDDEEIINTREKEDRIFSQQKLDEILKNFNANKDHAKASETRKESKEIAPQLFDLTLLQREANRKFGMPASRTLQAAQRLYEKHKLLTYPRTDSRYLPEDYVDNVKNILKEYSAIPTEYSKACQKILKIGLLNKERVFNNKHVSDHFAIIPTGQFPSEKLDGDDARIFDLVLKRFFAAFMSHAIWAKVERITAVGEQSFRTRVQDLQEPGWREVYGLDTEEESKLPKLNEKNSEEQTSVQSESIDPIQNATKPPPRYTEAKLLSLMEHCGKSVIDEEIAEVLKDKGIGTPATRADIIENLISKEYVSRYGKALKATSKGIRLVDVLNRIPIDILSKVDLTGEIEAGLRKMEKGQEKRSDFMQNMFDFTSTIVDKARTFEYDAIYKNDPPLGACPVCKIGKVFEGFWGYKCNRAGNSKETTPDQCNFIIWKEKSQRYIDRSVIEEVLNNKIVGPFEFSNSSGTSHYEEFLTVSPIKGIIFCDEKGEPKESATGYDAVVLHEELLNETFLKMPGTVKVTEMAYLCEFGVQPTEVNVEAVKPKRKSKKTSEDTEEKKKKVTKPKKVKRLISRMPRILCGREMTLEDYKSFILTGSTPPIADFKSKKGRPFAAALHLKENGNFEFKFVSRKALLGDNELEKSKKTSKKSTNKAKVVKKSKKTENVSESV
ncbi:DNA topoisomerase 3 [Fluviispira multicolorata]|uniref:DNA topoisomerase n=1 Tax=Fluviispira multicolorata TaxID=2654512 RepID=A0A833JD84_9BACT|nr:DNA topoisomerase 3 [Fluviispira multicolorata]KAB8030647.1 DNA topoisomerase III [Fluviispira multicolorata]